MSADKTFCANSHYWTSLFDLDLMLALGCKFFQWTTADLNNKNQLKLFITQDNQFKQN